jgi:hypothetical protein
MSDTPRTDAKAQFFGFNPDEGEEFVQADFARELERENAALREELKSSRKLVDALIIKADAFDYLAWLEKKRGEEEGLQGADFLCLASDGTTCWGKTYLEAVRIAEQQDRIAFDSAAIDAARKEQP